MTTASAASRDGQTFHHLPPVHYWQSGTQVAKQAWWLQMQSALQSVHSAFVMGPKERAVYLRKPVPKGPHAAEQSGEEEAGTLAGTNAAALRSWLRQVSA